MHLPFSPYIRVAWYSTLKPHTTIGPRHIFDYELLYIKEGTPVVTIEDQVYNAVPGDAFLIRPRQLHTIFCPNDYPVIQPHVHFDLYCRDDRDKLYPSFLTESSLPPEDRALFREDALKDAYPQLPPCVSFKNSPVFEGFLFDLIDEAAHPSLHSDLRMEWLFLRLLDLFISQASYSWQMKSLSKAESTASRIKLYLDNNASARITLDELADTLHLDKSYLVSLFKRRYGQTPIAYHQRLRVEKARDMLVYTNLSVTQIAQATGFSSIYDFDRVFRRLLHAAPSAFRMRQQDAAQDASP